MKGPERSGRKDAFSSVPLESIGVLIQVRGLFGRNAWVLQKSNAIGYPEPVDRRLVARRSDGCDSRTPRRRGGGGSSSVGDEAFFTKKGVKKNTKKHGQREICLTPPVKEPCQLSAMKAMSGGSDVQALPSAWSE